jgi:N-acetylglucosamine-6-phosphate deacetylase
MITALVNATIFTGKKKQKNKAVLIKGNLIESIIDQESVPASAKKIDCNGNFVAPGLIDLQIAGAGGYLFSANPTAMALKSITRAILKTGTTGFLIAIPTNTPDVYKKVFQTVRENPSPAVLGLHVEGPYISQSRRGAHMRNYIRVPSAGDVKDFLRDADDVVKMLTVAPEVCEEDVYRIVLGKNIVMAAGHSNSTFNEAITGFKRGITTTTHLFNAMSQLHHRDPGLPGAVFMNDKAYASIIADGIHVDYNILAIAKKLLKERLVLISDAVEENLNGAYLHVRKEDRFTLPDGTLSGSLLTMMKAVRNCVNEVGIPIDEALRMASTYPAKVIHLDDRGQLAEGYKADIVVFDNEFDVKFVLSDGEILSENEMIS